MKNNTHIRTNVMIDKQLLEETQKATGIDAPQQLVEHALHELIRHRQQRKLIDLKGKTQWKGDLNRD